MSSITYISSEKISVLDKLQEQVRFPLERVIVGETNLQQIIKKEKLERNMSYHEITLDDGQLAYLLLFKFHGPAIDRTLEKLARLYEFPRGFPILYIPSTDYLHVFGFYPKFANDYRQQKVDESVFANGSYLSGSIKISGYLGGVLPFIHNGRTYVLFASKNSILQNVDSRGQSFVSGVIDITTRFISEEAIMELAKTGAHLYGEFVANFDIVHGQTLPFNSENPNGISSMVCTMIGYGQIRTPSGIRDNTPVDKIIRYMTGSELNKFCVRFNIPRIGQFSISGREKIIAFMNDLESNRDMMTYSMLVEIFAKNGVDLFNVCLTHDKIYATDVIEGLVLNIDGNIIKYKFPGYTMRTMFCRSAIEHKSDSQQILESAKRFVNSWVISLKSRYIQKCVAVMNLINSGTLLNKGQFAEGTADHIMACELIDQMTFSDDVKIASMDNFSGIVNIVIINGIIGSGKSTVAKKVSSMIHNAMEIDGDSLFPQLNHKQSTALTMSLGQERNHYTRWQIINAILNGKIPVISTGGGVLCDNDGNCLIPLMIRNAFNVDVNMIQIVVDQTFDKIEPIVDTSFEFYASDQSRISVKNVIFDRIACGQWKIPKGGNQEKFVNDIASRSSVNQRFAEGIAEVASHKFGFPGITKKSRDQFMTSNLTEFDQQLSGILVRQSIPTSVLLTQVRLLISGLHAGEETRMSGLPAGEFTRMSGDFGTATHVGHITATYHNRSASYTLEHLSEIESRLSLTDPIYATKITILTPTKNSKKNLVFLAPVVGKVHEDQSDHVTINSGVHSPDKMKEVSQSVRADLKDIILDPSNSSCTKYDLTKKIVEVGTIVNHGVFGIV